MNKIRVIEDRQQVLNISTSDEVLEQIIRLCGYAHNPSDIAWGHAGIRFEDGQLSE